MHSDDRVFKALADSSRRSLLDRLFQRDGQSLSELESELPFGLARQLLGAAMLAAVPAGPSEVESEAAVPPDRGLALVEQLHDSLLDMVFPVGGG